MKCVSLQNEDWARDDKVNFVWLRKGKIKAVPQHLKSIQLLMWVDY